MTEIQKQLYIQVTCYYTVYIHKNTIEQIIALRNNNRYETQTMYGIIHITYLTTVNNHLHTIIGGVSTKGFLSASLLNST